MIARRTVLLFTIAISSASLGAIIAAKAFANNEKVAEAGDKVVKVERLELVDKHGETRALLETTDDFSAILELLDQKGNVKVQIGVTHDFGEFVVLRGPNNGAHKIHFDKEGQVLHRFEQDKEFEPRAVQD